MEIYTKWNDPETDIDFELVLRMPGNTTTKQMFDIVDRFFGHETRWKVR